MNAKVFWIESPAKGRIGIVPRPRGGDWLEVDVGAWRNDGVDVVVSLLESEEAVELGLADEARAVLDAGMQFEPFAIPDRSVPFRRDDAIGLAAALARLLNEGRTIVVHCRQGIGRSSLIVALVLMSCDVQVDVALAALRTARGLDVPETLEQQRWLESMASRVVSPP